MDISTDNAVLRNVAGQQWCCSRQVALQTIADDRPCLGAAHRGITHAQKSRTMFGTDAMLSAVEPAASASLAVTEARKT